MSGRRPEDLVLLDLPKAVRSRQSPVDGEPFIRVPEVREVESAEALQRHPCVPDDEVIFRPAAPSAVPNVEVEGLAAPLREQSDRIVEGAGILRAQFEESRELRLEATSRPIDRPAAAAVPARMLRPSVIRQRVPLGT